MAIDKKQLQLMLQMAEEKKREIDDLIQSLKQQLSGGSSSSNGKRGRPRGGARSETAQRIKAIMNEANDLMTPSEIHDALEQSGKSVSAAQIRNVLRRHKGDMFESPAHGKWKSKGKLFMSDMRAGAPETAATVDRDDDLPF
ncbi:hypothetical protein KQH82_07335 [bacterium]|nr:hypothetical protein [bacterium]